MLGAFLLLVASPVIAQDAEARIFSQNHHTIDSPANYVLCAHAADLDGDGDLDIVVGTGERDDAIAWYENLGQGAFSGQRVISTEVDHPRALDTADFDLDGDLDIVSASRYDNKIAWYENLGGSFAAQRVVTTAAYRTETVQAADLDGDGLPDIVWGSRAYQASVAWHQNIDGVDFSEQRVVATGVNGHMGVRAGDMDNDGDLDLVWASRDADAVAWQENNGEGEFGEHQRIGGTAGHEVHLEDLDLDGDLDFVANAPGDDDGNTRSVWYENAGQGEFVMQQLANDGPKRRRAYCSADLDGDGDRDVCSTSYDDDTTAWYENLGDGRFAHRVVSTTARGGLVSEAHDLDGDGDMDLLVAAYYSGVVWYENVLHTPPPRVPFGPARIVDTNFDHASSVHAADFDRDGDLDIVAAALHDDLIAWYENLGSGSFSPRRVITTAADSVEEIHAADLDGDGWPDIVSASYNDSKIAWYRNEGDGEFGDQRVITRNADGARFVHAADLDADGDNDVVSASWNDDRIAWYENDGTGVFSAQRTITTNADVGRSVHAADLDLDGDLDVLSASAHDDKIAWYENQGGGAFSPQRIIADDVRRAVSVYAADFDGDGYPDVVAAAAEGREIIWYRNEGNQRFSSPRIVMEGLDHPIFVHAADIDDDGDPDVVAASMKGNRVAWYENLGGGIFGVEHLISTSQNRPWSVHAADLDGDGDLDVLAAGAGDDTVAWYRNLTNSPTAAPTITATKPLFGRVEVAWRPIPPDAQGSSPIVSYVVRAESPHGAPTRQCAVPAHVRRCVVQNLLPGATYELAVHAESGVGRGPPSESVTVTLPHLRRGVIAYSDARLVATDFDHASSVHAADFDRDGDLDIVAAALHDDLIAWYENLGSGSFSPRRVITTAADSVEEIHAADLDGDGWPDVVSASYNDSKIAWYRNEGDGEFGDQRVITRNADGARFVHAADLDADGDNDVVSASWNDDRIAWYENDGTGVFSAQRTITTNADVGRSVHAADLDLDGDLDVLSASAHDDKIAWYENQGGGAFSPQRIIADDVRRAVSVYAADFDGDGYPDVVAAAAEGSEIIWYRNEGNQRFSSPRTVMEGLDHPIFVHAADVDDDGDPDVVAASMKGNRVAWYENLGGGVFGVEHLISTSQNRPWSVHAADLDGDGDLDVLAAGAGDDTVAWYQNLGLVPTAPVLAPRDVRVVAGLESIAVSWSRVPAAGDGGAAILRYLVVATPKIGTETVTCTGSAADAGCTLDGLTPGMAYSITVRAENEQAPGPASTPLTVRAACPPSVRGASRDDDTVVRISSPPGDAAGSPRHPAQSSLRWSSSSPQGYSITLDDETAFACPSSGSAAAGEAVEITLVADCPEAGQREVGVTIAAGEATATATWHVRCSDGNAALLVLEHHQGPMTRQWRSATGEWEVHTPTLAGRRAAIVARLGHDSPAIPGVSIRLRDEAGAELAAELHALLDPHTSPPERSASRLWETEYALDLPGDLYREEHLVRIEVDPTNAILETDESDNVFDFPISAERLPRFRILFIPIKSVVGEPAEIDADTYMTHIHDFFPIADDYVAEVGETFAFETQDWDQHDATVALLTLWNSEADGDEYWHGIYQYPYDGSSCGYAFLGGHVSVGAAVDGGCTRNITVHEVGHSLNLRHPRDGCGADNADEDYPYDHSGIGPRRGWFFSAGRFVNPNDGFADTMSYCGPDFFISDYHYRKAFDHLRSQDEATSRGTVANATSAAAKRGPVAGSANGGTDGRKAAGDAEPRPAPRSIAVTGVVDRWGTWSVRRASLSTKPPRTPPRGDHAHELVLVDTFGIEGHRQPLALHPASTHDGSAAWAVRCPIPDERPVLLVIRGPEGHELLRYDLRELMDAP